MFITHNSIGNSLFRQNMTLNYQVICTFAAKNGLVAQWIEQQPSKLRVEGSSPSGVTGVHKIAGCYEPAIFFYAYTYINFLLYLYLYYIVTGK